MQAARSVLFAAMAVLMLVACRRPVAPTVPMQTGPAKPAQLAEAPLTQGQVEARPPVLLADIEARPVDVAVFDEQTAMNFVTASDDRYPVGRFDMPWIPRSDVKDDAARAFDPKAAPYWCAALPAALDLDLGQVCYVTQIVVRGYGQRDGVTNFSAKVVTDDGEAIDTVPPCSVTVRPDPPAEGDRPGAVLAASFRPVATQRLRFAFAMDPIAGADRLYVQTIRVLGKRLEAPSVAPAASVPKELADPLASQPVNLVPQDPAVIQKCVRVSEDRYPNGAFELAWIFGEFVTDDGVPIPPYWCAAQPAWAEVDLGKTCFITKVVIQPYSEAYGLTEFYMKIIDAAGNEVDTTPPCAASSKPIKPPGSGAKPEPFSVAFDPVSAQRLKFYFPRGGFQNEFVYVDEIQVLGLPAGAT